MGLFDKKITSEERENRKKYIDSFCRFFSEYYTQNTNISNISYREMPKDEGYSAIIEYKDFKQYVNIYWDTYENCAINSCFELESRGFKFLCHFVDILNETDSDDISFYVFTHCAEQEKMRSSLNALMHTTEKYYTDICNITASKEHMDNIFKDIVLDEALDEGLNENDIDKEDIPSVPEEATDFLYTIYEMLYDRNELKKVLTKSAKKNKLDNKYEKRAYRVLSSQSKGEIKEYEKAREKSTKYPLKDRIIMYTPSIIIAVVFGIVFGFLGIQLDKYLYPDLIGKDYMGTVVSFFILGIAVSILPISLIPNRFYKLFVPKKHYDEFLIMLESEKLTKLDKIVFSVIAVIGIAIIFVLCAFTGVAFTNDGNIVSKDFIFSKAETYSLADTEIAAIDDVDGDGIFDYTERAYAFKIDGEWIEFGVPDDETKAIIESAVEKNHKQVKVYEYFDDIED